MTQPYSKPYTFFLAIFLVFPTLVLSQINLFAKYYAGVQQGIYATPYKAVSLVTPGSPFFLCGSGDSVNVSGTLVQKLDYNGFVVKSKFLGLGITYGNYANIATNGSNLIAVTTRGNSYEGNVMVLLDTGLNVISSQGYNTALGYSFLTCIGHHSSGYFFVGGTGLGNAPIAVSKIDEAGNLLWSKTLLSGDAGDIKVIKQMGDGNLLIAGALDNRAGALTDAFVLKMTPDGDVLWATQSRLGDQAQVFDVLEQPYNKGIIAVGSFNTTNGTNSNGFVWQLDNNGVAKKTLKLYYFSSAYTKIALMEYGHFMVAGNGQKAFGTSGSMIFTEFDEDMNVKKNHCFNNSVWLTLPNYLKYEANGTLTTTFVNGMARFDPDFSFIPCLATSCDLDTFSIPGEYNTLQGSSFNYPLTKATYTATVSDFQLVETTVCDTTVSSVFTHLEEPTEEQIPIRIFPNPTNDYATIDFAGITGLKKITLTNINGQITQTFTVNGYNANVNLENTPSGIYFLKIERENSYSEVLKLIKL